MSSSFFGLHIALSGLQAQQKGMEVTGHNIANANSTGYSRQQAVLVPGNSIDVNGLRLGAGVDVETIRRLRDEFLDVQMRHNNTQLGYWETKQDMLQQVEVVFMEPSENGLASMMGKFWDSWQEVSQNPENSRVSLVQNATALADGINKVYSDLSELVSNIDQSLEVTTADINNKISQIAQLNDQIRNSWSDRQPPNDLLDRRTVLLGELAELVDIQAQSTEQGMVDVYIDGKPVVTGVNGRELAVNFSGGAVQIQWKDTASGTFNVDSGKLKGLIDARTEIEDNYLAALDTLADTLITQVNARHRVGYSLPDSAGNVVSGSDFFDPVPAGVSPASFIKVADAIVNDPGLVAAASTMDGSPGDGSNALNIAQLSQARLLHSGSATFDEYYTESISGLGVATQEAERMTENIIAMQQQIDRRQENVAGVSLDEEMTNLMQYQHAYSAAARVISTIDEMLDVLINRMG